MYKIKADQISLSFFLIVPDDSESSTFSHLDSATLGKDFSSTESDTEKHMFISMIM